MFVKIYLVLVINFLVNIVMPSILQLRKIEYKEVNYIAKATKLVTGRTGFQAEAILLWGP